jgi:hypothetical protein
MPNLTLLLLLTMGWAYYYLCYVRPKLHPTIKDPHKIIMRVF